jgi:hypothetical protein
VGFPSLATKYNPFVESENVSLSLTGKIQRAQVSTHRCIKERRNISMVKNSANSKSDFKKILGNISWPIKSFYYTRQKNRRWTPSDIVFLILCTCFQSIYTHSKFGRLLSDRSTSDRLAFGSSTSRCSTFILFETLLGPLHLNSYCRMLNFKYCRRSLSSYGITRPSTRNVVIVVRRIGILASGP